jgi:cytochrome c oxidase cbb3-type subunit III
MSEFVSPFWDVAVAVVTMVSIVACAVFLKSQSVTTSGKTTGHTWDEDLAEYNNPLPSWWRWMFYITIAFSIIYLILYPGLGSWKGMLGWSQVAQLKDENAVAEKQLAPLYSRFAAMTVEQLAADRDAIAVGQKLFLNHCAQCHASDAGGSRGFPSLADKDWLWGGDVKAIETTITEGRAGRMPPWGAVLGEAGVKDVAHFVLSMSGSPHDSIRKARGEALFKTNCSACHGSEGKGSTLMGAPNLTDKIWLHGSGEAAIIETITKGRSSQMPAHKDDLSPAKIRLLTGYVYSLSADKQP